MFKFKLPAIIWFLLISFPTSTISIALSQQPGSIANFPQSRTLELSSHDRQLTNSQTISLSKRALPLALPDGWVNQGWENLQACFPISIAATALQQYYVNLATVTQTRAIDNNILPIRRLRWKFGYLVITMASEAPIPWTFALAFARDMVSKIT